LRSKLQRLFFLAPRFPCAYAPTGPQITRFARANGLPEVGHRIFRDDRQPAEHMVEKISHMSSAWRARRKQGLMTMANFPHSARFSIAFVCVRGMGGD
jgi:hypothetical protein